VPPRQPLPPHLATQPPPLLTRRARRTTAPPPLPPQITKRVRAVAEKHDELQRARSLKEAVVADPSMLWRKEAHREEHTKSPRGHHWKPEKDWQR